MQFCLKFSVAAGCLISAVTPGLQAANLAKRTVVAPSIRSVVRADLRTGRLVRTVVVQPRVVESVPVQATAAVPVPENSPVGAHDVPAIVEETARRYDLDPLLVHSVMQVESANNPYAISPKGAQGLMQLMPGTARRFGVANSFDVRQNIEGGARYLKYLQMLFPNDLRLTLAAYNAGEGAVWKYNNQIPPYRETEQYVYKVAKKYVEAKTRRGNENRKIAQAAPLQPGPVKSEEPAYSPVNYFVDENGRLHMTTSVGGATP